MFPQKECFSGGAAGVGEFARRVRPSSMHSFAQAVGYECQPFATGMGGDVQVIDTDGLPLLCQCAANAAVMLRRLGSVRQHLQTGAKINMASGCAELAIAL